MVTIRVTKSSERAWPSVILKQSLLKGCLQTGGRPLHVQRPAWKLTLKYSFEDMQLWSWRDGSVVVAQTAFGEDLGSVPTSCVVNHSCQ